MTDFNPRFKEVEIDFNEKELVFRNEDLTNIVTFTLLKGSSDSQEEYSNSQEEYFDSSEKAFTSLELNDPAFGYQFDDYPSNNIFTTFYNTAVELVSPLMEYAYDFFWGSK